MKAFKIFLAIVMLQISVQAHSDDALADLVKVILGAKLIEGIAQEFSGENTNQQNYSSDNRVNTSSGNNGSLGYQYYVLGQKSCKSGDHQKALKWFRESKQQGYVRSVENVYKACSRKSVQYTQTNDKKLVRNSNRTYKKSECTYKWIRGYDCYSGNNFFQGSAEVDNNIVYPGMQTVEGRFVRNPTADSRVVDRIIFKKGRGSTVFAKGDNRPFTGKFIKRYGDGQKEIEALYVDGKKHGTETYWYQNGEKWKVNNWKYNSKDGVQIVWEKEPIKRGSNNETDIYEHVYSGGKLISTRKLDFYQNSNLNASLSKVKPKEFSSANPTNNKFGNNDSFSDLWGEYGGSILDSKGNIKQQPNYVSNTSTDTKAPTISLNQSSFATVESSNINLSGSIKDDSDVAEVNINGGLIAVDDSGNFDRTMYLSLGKNKFTIEALDIFGNKSSKTITVIRNMIIVENKDKKLTPPTVRLASNPDSVALIIGLDDYKTMPNAPWAESDASTFYDYAHNVLGIPIERIRLITGQESNSIGIWKSLEQWLPSQVDKNKSNIYVYFSGHGLASEDGKEAYLMPYDGDTSMLSRTAILRKDVINGLDKLKARSVTLFMDTCYSGAARGGQQTLVASRGLRIVKKNTLADLPSNFTLFSAAANNETAISHPTQKNGLFSYWMMRGLEGEADSNNDNKLTNGELHAFISDKVQKTAISKGHNQHPQLVGDKDKVIASW